MFENLLNGKRLLAVYFLGGIAGFLMYFIGYNIFPLFSPVSGTIIGASASIMAILVAIATYQPNIELRLILIGNVKLKYIALFFVAIDVLFLDGGNTGGRIAHLGGALFGFLYARQLQKGNDWSKGFFVVTDFFGQLIHPKPKMKVASSRSSSSRPTTATSEAARPSKRDKDHQKKIDTILDKISQSGYDSLTKAEKEYLFNASKK